MIFYHSGTGNTRLVAESLANLLCDRTVRIDYELPAPPIIGERQLIFCFPVYSWGVPKVVDYYIKHLPREFAEYVNECRIPVLMVCTCGDETGLAHKIFEKSIRRARMEVAGMWSVIMPNNYVMLPGFDVDSRDEEQRKLADAPARIKDIATAIAESRFEVDVHVGPLAWLKSCLVYPLFKRWGVDPKRWRSMETCVNCGLCVKVCPVGNMRMGENGPEWGARCESCDACYHRCPRHAVEYGAITKRKGQYFCTLSPIKK